MQPFRRTRLRSRGIREAAGLGGRGLGKGEQRLKLQVWAVHGEKEGGGWGGGGGGVEEKRNWAASNEEYSVD